jgi:diguanylate cyclase (GGDEF)-like protein/putative nucleotidyltransferase with HDIG domain
MNRSTGNPLPGQSPVRQRYRIIIALMGTGILAWAVTSLVKTPPAFDWLILSLITVLAASRVSVRLPQNFGSISASDIFLFFSLLEYGLAPTVVLAVADGLYGSLKARHRKQTILFNASVMGLSFFCAGWLGKLALTGESVHLRHNLQALVMLLIVAATAHYLINSGLIALNSALRDRVSPFETWREHYQWAGITYFSSAAAAGIVFHLTTIFSVYAFLLVLPIAALTWLIYKGNLEKVEASQQHADEMAKLHLDTIEALATAIDAKDQTTHEHVRRVQIYAEGMARIFGLTEAEIQALHVGALLHDIGKLAVPDHILNKPGRLTPGEFEKMKIHTIVGAEILSRVNFPYPVVPIVRSHHERWDGKGYPDALAGAEIPMTARILTVVDCFDAVREDRPYRRGLTREQAINMLLEGSQTQFDPSVVNTFIENLPTFEAEIAEVLAAEAIAQIKREKIDWSDPTVREKFLRGNTAAPSAGYAAEPAAAKPSSSPAYLDQIRSAQTEGTALYALARSISSSLDPARIIEVLREKLSPIIPFDTCALFINQTAELSATARFVTGKNAELIRGSRITYGNGVTGFVLAQRRIFANTDPGLDFLELGLNLPEQYQNVISCPLLRGEELCGVLTLYSLSADQYSVDHLRLMETVSATVSDAIANALQHAQPEETTTDTLTGLPNARLLEIIFSKEVHRAERYGYPLALLALDVDDFRKFNDEHGYATGDRLLRDLARLLSAEFRAGDTFARPGGDEFVVLLHRLTPDLVDDLKARIRKTLTAWRFKAETAQKLSVSLSLGHAVYGEDGRTLPEMIEAARDRLRRSSSTGSALTGTDNLRIFPGVKRGRAGHGG